MTTTTREQTAELIDAIAAAGEALDASGSEVDALEIVHALRPLMAPSIWADIATAWELCPTHGCDEQICADDSADCEAGR